jgi:hypothetical protein
MDLTFNFIGMLHFFILIQVDAGEELILLLTDVAPFLDRSDSVKWIADRIGKFSVSPAYQFLQNRISAMAR